MTVKAMKSGAVEFLTKTFSDQDLLYAIHQALDRDLVRRRKQSELKVAMGLASPIRRSKWTQCFSPNLYHLPIRRVRARSD
jgi:FixJ family two-component response regulator